jgi:hypothetical protein
VDPKGTQYAKLYVNLIPSVALSISYTGHLHDTSLECLVLPWFQSNWPKIQQTNRRPATGKAYSPTSQS